MLVLGPIRRVPQMQINAYCVLQVLGHLRSPHQPTHALAVPRVRGRVSLELQAFLNANFVAAVRGRMHSQLHATLVLLARIRQQWVPRTQDSASTVLEALGRASLGRLTQQNVFPATPEHGPLLLVPLIHQFVLHVLLDRGLRHLDHQRTVSLVMLGHSQTQLQPLVLQYVVRVKLELGPMQEQHIVFRAMQEHGPRRNSLRTQLLASNVLLEHGHPCLQRHPTLIVLLVMSVRSLALRGRQVLNPVVRALLALTPQY